MTGSFSQLMSRMLVVALISVLAGCAGPQFGQSPSPIAKAERAISERNWVVAYRHLEDVFASPNEAVRTKALQLYADTPQLRSAAAQTFTAEALKTSFEKQGYATGVAIEKYRLSMYRLVATDAEYRVASSNFENLSSGYQAGLLAEEERRKAAEALAKQKEADALAKQLEELKELDRQLEASRRNAVFHCKDRLQCEKAFALTQIFIATNSDMRIQLANDTLIETYNPNKDGAMGATAMKVPGAGTSAVVMLDVVCKQGRGVEPVKACKRSAIVMNNDFGEFIKKRLVD